MLRLTFSICGINIVPKLLLNIWLPRLHVLYRLIILQMEYADSNYRHTPYTSLCVTVKNQNYKYGW